MESPLSLTYHQDESRANVRGDPVAGEGFALGALYPPRAVVCWRDAGGRHDAHLLAPAHHVFRNDADARQGAIAPAKRFIDTKLAGLLMPGIPRSPTCRRRHGKRYRRDHPAARGSRVRGAVLRGAAQPRAHT